MEQHGARSGAVRAGAAHSSNESQIVEREASGGHRGADPLVREGAGGADAVRQLRCGRCRLARSFRQHPRLSLGDEGHDHHPSGELREDADHPRRYGYDQEGELAAGEIASRFSSSGPTISRHLSVLRQAGLVTERREANRILYSPVGERLALSGRDFLSTVCPEQIVLREIRKRGSGRGEIAPAEA